ncbi:6902_t:CDS:2, partial [Dentiscutata erythropus]
DQIDPNYIKQSFTCCGIFTAQYGSEEDLIFDYNWVIMYISNKYNKSNNESTINLTQNNNNNSDYDSYDNDAKDNNDDDNIDKFGFS